MTKKSQTPPVKIIPSQDPSAGSAPDAKSSSHSSDPATASSRDNKPASRTKFPKSLLFCIIISVAFISTVAGILASCIISGQNAAPSNQDIASVSAGDSPDSEIETDPSSGNTADPEPESPEKPPRIDFQPMINSWLKTASGTSGIAVYDLDRRELVGSHNSTLTMNGASLYKLYAAVAGYQYLEQNPAKSSAILTDKYTWKKCIDLAVRESNITCGSALASHLKIDRMIVSASDLVELLQKIWYNTSDPSIPMSSTNSNTTTLSTAKLLLSEESRRDLLDSMLNQPPSKGLCKDLCNWRQGLPSGFSKNAKVYNKVGWEHAEGPSDSWNLYHDAAIVEIKDRHFAVVLMTKNGNLRQVVNFAKQFESYLLTF